MKKAKIVFFSVVLMSIISIVLLFLAAILVTKAGILPVEVTPAITSVIGAVAAFLGAWLVVSRKKEKGLLYGFCAGAAFSFIIFIVSVLVFKNPVEFSGVWKLSAIIFGGMLGGILSVNRKNKVKF